MPPRPTLNPSPTLELLASMVVKQGLSIGLLSEGQRDLALALAASALPLAVACSEAEVNRALQRCLMAEAAFLDTDHVELRRWLVDAGWLDRDGFGRAYCRRPPAQLRQEQQVVPLPLEGLDLDAWAARALDVQNTHRQARRQAWKAGQGAGA